MTLLWFRQLRELGPAVGVLLALASATWAQGRAVTLAQFSGATFVRRAGTAEYRPAELKMALAPGDIVRTGSNGEAVLLLPNGSEMRLRANSVVAIPAMRGPGKPEGVRRDGDWGWKRPGPDPRFRWDSNRALERPRDVGPGRPPDPGRPPVETFDRFPPGKPFMPRPPHFYHRRGPGELDVTVRRSGTGEFVKVEGPRPLKLNTGDIVRTGSNSSLVVRFFDGSQIKVKENAALLVPPAARQARDGSVGIAVIQPPMAKPAFPTPPTPPMPPAPAAKGGPGRTPK